MSRALPSPRALAHKRLLAAIAIFAYRAVAGRDRAMFDTCNRLDYDEAQSAQNICVNMTGANYLEGELAGVKLDHGCSLLRNFRLYAGFKNFYNPLCC